jgi:hypothetical protein
MPTKYQIFLAFIYGCCFFNFHDFSYMQERYKQKTLRITEIFAGIYFHIKAMCFKHSKNKIL